MTASPFYTPRLLLRPPDAADAAVIRWLCDDLRVARGLLDPPCACTLAEAGEWIDSVHGEKDSGFARTFLIERRERPEVLGSISLLFGQNPVYAEVSCWIGGFHWRHGYAGEALRAILYHAFLQLRLSGISAWCPRSSSASTRLVQKAGFSQDGTDAGIRRAADGRIFNCHRLASSAWRAVHLDENC